MMLSRRLLVQFFDDIANDILYNYGCLNPKTKERVIKYNEFILTNYAHCKDCVITYLQREDVEYKDKTFDDYLTPHFDFSRERYTWNNDRAFHTEINQIYNKFIDKIEEHLDSNPDLLRKYRFILLC